MRYPIAKIDSFAKVKGGKRLPKEHDFSLTPTLHPYIRARDIGNGRIDIVEPVYISEETYNVIKQYAVSTNDVCITIVGANVGDIGFIPSYLDGANLTENAAKIVDLQDVDSRFLKYALLEENLQNTMRQVAAGAAQPKLGIYKIESLEIPKPLFQIQQRIADILTAYDDLIDTNTRRIALLEESIHRLYKEWFVYLRFPGCDRVKVVNGVPEGWSSQTLNDISSEIRQGIHPSQTEPNTPYVGLEHIPRQSIALTDWGFSRDVDSNKFKFAYRDVLFGKIRPYFHKVVIAPTIGICSSDTIVMRPTTDEFLGLLLSLTSSAYFVDFTSKTSKEGSKMPRADWKAMKQYPILVPPQPILNDFNIFVVNSVSQIENLIFTNQKLREARDLLLPRLMNGSIAV